MSELTTVFLGYIASAPLVISCYLVSLAFDLFARLVAPRTSNIIWRSFICFTTLVVSMIILGSFMYVSPGALEAVFIYPFIVLKGQTYVEETLQELQHTIASWF